MKYAYLLPALLLGACVDNNESVDIDRFLFVSQTSMCAADPSNAANRGRGLLDVGIVSAGAAQGVSGYIVAPVVRNNMPLRGAAGQIDMDAVTIQKFQVELRPDSTIAGAIPATMTTFDVPVAGGRIEAGGTFTAAMLVEVIPPQVAEQLAKAVPVSNLSVLPLMIVHMRPVATRVDGNQLFGGWSDFPVDICNFCLTQQPTQCPAMPQKPTDVNQSGCFIQQDDPVTCCTEGGGSLLLCGAAVPQTTM